MFLLNIHSVDLVTSNQGECWGVEGAVSESIIAELRKYWNISPGWRVKYSSTSKNHW